MFLLNDWTGSTDSTHRESLYCRRLYPTYTTYRPLSNSPLHLVPCLTLSKCNSVSLSARISKCSMGFMTKNRLDDPPANSPASLCIYLLLLYTIVLTL